MIPVRIPGMALGRTKWRMVAGLFLSEVSGGHADVTDAVFHRPDSGTGAASLDVDFHGGVFVGV